MTSAPLFEGTRQLDFSLSLKERRPRKHRKPSLCQPITMHIGTSFAAFVTFDCITHIDEDGWFFVTHCYTEETSDIGLSSDPDIFGHLGQIYAHMSKDRQRYLSEHGSAITRAPHAKLISSFTKLQ
ncbi:uncharacterized protein HD556DRAFT_1303434 [Suillus plorans]|uniref:Uncharacterized protein n=1 Tax=Suillus plorans TaxID=116603 RepID=A0A9P7J617_9AGAM|nr:uncharacterized protein HD556DRAFT_1303434 [Suillus plorans]KAG1804895.1 hypothetical protein HD556DRAFT_1303434 [Suillus plorans]